MRLDSDFLRRIDVTAVVRHLSPNNKALGDVFKNTERLISDLILIVVREIKSIDEDIHYWVRLCQGSEWEVTLARYNLIIYRKVKFSLFGIKYIQEDLPEWTDIDSIENYVTTLKNIKSRVVAFLFDIYRSGEKLKEIVCKVNKINMYLKPINKLRDNRLFEGEIFGEDDDGDDGDAAIDVNLVEFSLERLYLCNFLINREINAFLYGRTDAEEAAACAQSISDSGISHLSPLKKNSLIKSSNLYSYQNLADAALLNIQVPRKDAFENSPLIDVSSKHKLYFHFSDSDSLLELDICEPSDSTSSFPLEVIVSRINEKMSKDLKFRGLKVEYLRHRSKEYHEKIIFYQKYQKGVLFCDFSLVNSKDAMFDLLGFNFEKRLKSFCSENGQRQEVIAWLFTEKLQKEYLKNKSFFDTSCVIITKDNNNFSITIPAGYEGQVASLVVPEGNYSQEELVAKLKSLLKGIDKELNFEFDPKTKKLKITHNRYFAIKISDSSILEEIGFDQRGEDDLLVAEERTDGSNRFEVVSQKEIKLISLLYNIDAKRHAMDDRIVPQQYRLPSTYERYWLAIFIGSISAYSLGKYIATNYDLPHLIKTSAYTVLDGLKEVISIIKKTYHDTVRALSSIQEEMNNDKKELRESYNDLIKSKKVLNDLLDEFFEDNPKLLDSLPTTVEISSDRSPSGILYIENTNNIDNAATQSAISATAKAAATDQGVSLDKSQSNSVISPYVEYVVDSCKYYYLRSRGFIMGSDVTPAVEEAVAVAETITDPTAMSPLGELSSSNPHIKLDQITKDKLKLVSDVYDAEMEAPISNMVRGNLVKSVSIQFQNIKYKTESLILKLDEIMQKNRFYIIIMSVIAPLSILGSTGIYIYRRAAEFFTPKASKSNSDSRKLHGILIKAHQTFENSIRRASPTYLQAGGEGAVTPRRRQESSSISSSAQATWSKSDIRQFNHSIDLCNYKYYNGLFFYYLYVLRQEALNFYVESNLTKLKRKVTGVAIEENIPILSYIYKVYNFLSAVWGCIPILGFNRYTAKYGPKDYLIKAIKKDIRQLEDSFLFFPDIERSTPEQAFNPNPERVQFVTRTFTRMIETYPCFSPINLIKQDSSTLDIF